MEVIFDFLIFFCFYGVLQQATAGIVAGATWRCGRCVCVGASEADLGFPACPPPRGFWGRLPLESTGTKVAGTFLKTGIH